MFWLDEYRSELNDSLIGRHHRNASENQEEEKGDSTQGKNNKPIEKGRSSKVDNRLVDSSFSRQPQKDRSDKQQMG